MIKDIELYLNFIKMGDGKAEEKVVPEVILIESVKLNMKDLCSYESYHGKIPVVLGDKILKVGLVRVEQNASGLQKRGG